MTKIDLIKVEIFFVKNLNYKILFLKATCNEPIAISHLIFHLSQFLRSRANEYSC